MVAVKKLKKEHGKILSDSESYITLGYILWSWCFCIATFSSFLFSPSGKKLLYIAEKAEPKEVPFFGTQDGTTFIMSIDNL